MGNMNQNKKKFSMSTETDLHFDLLADQSKLKFIPNNHIMNDNNNHNDIYDNKNDNYDNENNNNDYDNDNNEINVSNNNYDSDKRSSSSQIKHDTNVDKILSLNNE